MQTKKASLWESLFNTFSGFFVSLLLAYYVFPLFGMPQSFENSFSIVVIFTVVSIVRNYVIRRLFNFLHVKEGKTIPSSRDVDEMAKRILSHVVLIRKEK